MSGLGLSAYGLSKFGYPADDPATLVPAKIGSSRLIDGKTKTYQLADDAGFESMGDTAQRVYLLTSLAVGDDTPFIDDRTEQTMKQRVTEALAPLLDTRDPDIELQDIIFSDNGADTTFEGVAYKDKRATTVERKTPK